MCRAHEVHKEGGLALVKSLSIKTPITLIYTVVLDCILVIYFCITNYPKT